MPELHLIGNAHLDPVWLWRWQEGFAEVKATFRSALDRMEDFPDFIFTCACAAYYQWVEENEPAMFEEVRRRVEEGRWVLAGGWWIQPDCNLPSGESFARHALYSQRYFMEKFGRIAETGYNVDSFGHNGMLPQLLRKSGMTNYVMMRPDGREKELPANAFWWQSPDGSRVLTYRIPYGYETNWKPEGIEGKADAVAALAEGQGTPQMLFYGVGNHGGGPTVANLMRIEELRAARGAGRLDYSSPDAYFRELRAGGRELPVVTGDLQHHASGCYSAVSEIKTNNRRAEQRLVAAEKMMTVAHWLLGLPYRGDRIRKAWQGVLFNQFHDIMGGCSVREAYDDARELHGEALSLAAAELNAAVQKIAWAIDTAGGEDVRLSKDFDWALWERERGGAPIVVFNTLCWDVTAPVQVTKRLAGLTDETGAPVALQHVRALQTNVDDKWDTLFLASIPAMGYRVYRAYKQREIGAAPGGRGLHARECTLENDWLRLELDADTGYIKSLFDKTAGRDVFDGPGAVPISIDDSGNDTWAHGVFSFRNEAGRFVGATVRIIEDGPLRATLRAVSRLGASELRQDFSLYRDRPGVNVSVKLNWQEKHRILKLSFPVAVRDARPVYEIPYGALPRAADGKEYPGQAWVDVAGAAGDGSPCGLALANTSKYSYDVREGELRLTVARSAAYADHYGRRDELMEFMDQGIQYFSYTLLPHRGDWRASGIVRRAQELLNPPITVLETYHKGLLPHCLSFLSVDHSSVAVAALKRAEDGAGLVLRCVETAGESVEAEINLGFAGLRWRAAFAPFEIKTFRIGESGEIAESDLLERENMIL